MVSVRRHFTGVWSLKPKGGITSRLSWRMACTISYTAHGKDEWSPLKIFMFIKLIEVIKN